jgi:hypothetical protein
MRITAKELKKLIRETIMESNVTGGAAPTDASKVMETVTAELKEMGFDEEQIKKVIEAMKVAGFNKELAGSRPSPMLAGGGHIENPEAFQRLKETKKLIKTLVKEALLQEMKSKEKPRAVSVWKEPETRHGWSGVNLKHGDTFERTGKKAKNGMVEVEHGKGKTGWASDKALKRLEDK